MTINPALRARLLSATGMSVSSNRQLALVEEVLELLGAAWVAELARRLGLELGAELGDDGLHQARDLVEVLALVAGAEEELAGAGLVGGADRVGELLVADFAAPDAGRGDDTLRVA